MRMVTTEGEKEQADFAKRAAMYFAKHEKIFTYTDEEIKKGCFFALRFGLGNDCVVVLKLDSEHEPTNYQQLIREYSHDKR